MPHDDLLLPESVSEMAQLGQLLEEHRPRLLAMVQRRIDPALSSRVDAEDVLTEAFLQARRRWRVFVSQPQLRPYPWLYRITLDCLIEVWRRETRGRRDPRGEIPWPDHSSIQLGLGLIHPGTSPSEAAAREELRQSMKRVLDLLPAEDRELLRMRHEDGLSHVETGEVLGITANAATVRYVRALKRLRDLWTQIHTTDKAPS
jgi:RNA polymerase sigma-70 factor (ECF subfamily)